MGTSSQPQFVLEQDMSRIFHQTGPANRWRRPEFSRAPQLSVGILVGVALATPLTWNQTPPPGFRERIVLDDRGHGHGDRLDHAGPRPPLQVHLTNQGCKHNLSCRNRPDRQ